jgi:hypothetical protein
MKKLLKLPHRICESTCYVNGLEDILAWKIADYSDFLLSIVGGMADPLPPRRIHLHIPRHASHVIEKFRAQTARSPTQAQKLSLRKAKC